MTPRRTMTSLITSASLALGVMASASVQAEVRLQVSPKDGAVEVRVEETRSGPWTLVGGNDHLVLNPGGDAFGDGFPGQASRGNEALVAWIRPASSTLRLSPAKGGRWGAERGLDTDPAPAGVPRVGSLDTGWSVAWLSDAELGRTRLLGLDPDLNSGEADDQLLIEGQLLDAITRDGVTQLVTIHGMQVDLHTVVWSTVPGVPKPIDVVNLRSLLDLDGISGLPVLLSTTARSSEASVFLAWRGTDGTVSYLVLTPEGPELPWTTLEAPASKPLHAVLRSAGVLRGPQR